MPDTEDTTGIRTVAGDSPEAQAILGKVDDHYAKLKRDHPAKYAELWPNGDGPADK